MKPKERIFVKGDDMTKYQETALVRRAVLKQLKKERRVSTLSFPTTEKKSDWPKYITDNPFYP
jgi:hypothetical protein